MSWPSIVKRKHVINYDLRRTEATQVRAALLDVHFPATDGAVLDVMYWQYLMGSTLDEAIAWRIRQGKGKERHYVRDTRL